MHLQHFHSSLHCLQVLIKLIILYAEIVNSLNHLAISVDQKMCEVVASDLLIVNIIIMEKLKAKAHSI